MVNKVTLIGNLGRDVETRHLENGAVVGRFSVATNENYKDKSGEWKQKTEWHDVVVWRNLAERAEKQLKRGSLVFIEGKLTHRKWQDSNGNDRYTTEVVANTFRALDRRENQGGGNMGGSFPSTADDPGERYQTSDASPRMNSDSVPPATAPVVDAGSKNQSGEDDLPF